MAEPGGLPLLVRGDGLTRPIITELFERQANEAEPFRVPDAPHRDPEERRGHREPPTPRPLLDGRARTEEHQDRQPVEPGAVHVHPRGEQRHHPPRRPVIAPDDHDRGEQQEARHVRARRDVRQHHEHGERDRDRDRHERRHIGRRGTTLWSCQCDERRAEQRAESHHQHPDGGATTHLLRDRQRPGPPPARDREVAAGEQERDGCRESALQQFPAGGQMREEAVVTQRSTGDQRDEPGGDPRECTQARLCGALRDALTHELVGRRLRLCVVRLDDLGRVRIVGHRRRCYGCGSRRRHRTFPSGQLRARSSC